MIIEKRIRAEVDICKRLEGEDLPKRRSSRWQHWNTTQDVNTCEDCAEKHGRIYAIGETPAQMPPLHEHCRCILEIMDAVEAEAACLDGEQGAPWWLFYRGILPEYYIAIDALRGLGWRSGQNPDKYAPGKMLFLGVYPNTAGKLPDAPGRVWYEADIDYHGGRRGGHRVIWSNDGLMFVTYDHYATFIEVIGG